MSTASPDLGGVRRAVWSGYRRRARPLAAAAGHDPRWVRPAVAGLLALSALTYLWGLGASGNANSFYAAAVQAGTKSWKALFFGSFDASNFITVDKPPASLWVMSLSGRIFGFSAWSMLAPQALEGVAAVGLLYLTVRRVTNPRSGLLAAGLFAFTPVAALMFRFNNPDALLVLLFVLGAYCVTRAVEAASLRWLALAGAATGVAFLTKLGQAFLVVPAFGLVYLVAAPTTVGRRIVHLLGGLAAMVVAAGWYVAAVELWPKGSRPYIGGSTNNSLLQLTFGYNGLGRLTGNESGGGGGGMRLLGGGGAPVLGQGGGMAGGFPGIAGPGGESGDGPGGGIRRVFGPGGGGGGFGGATGWNRLFSDQMGTEISWLLPAALLALVAGLWLTRRAPRTDRVRAALILFGTWLVVHAVVFSYMQGIIHPYYTIVLAPAIGGLIAVGGYVLVRDRNSAVARGALAVMVGGTGIWCYVLLHRTPGWYPWLRWLVLLAALVAAAAILLVPAMPATARRVAAGTARRATAVAITVAALIGLAGAPAAYAAATASVAHTGSIPSSGPNGAGGFGGGGFGRPPGAATITPEGGGGPSLTGGSGGPGGDTANAALVSMLKAGAGSYRWVAATQSSNSAAPIELATGDPIMAMGGFSGSDPALTLAQFQAYVAAKKIHYYIGGGMGGPGGGSSGIESWVSAHFTATTVGGQTVYDLTRPKG